MLDGWLFPSVATHDLEELWFQQDGAKPHTAHETIDLLRTTFDGRIISLGGDFDWPPRSCDLMPLEFFFVGLREVDRLRE